MTIINYTIKKSIGQGGMATVYLANHQQLQNQVAIKVLSQEYVRNENIRKRFLAEARNMASMSHPNIIKVTDLIDDGDTVAFVMEHIEGETLKEYIERKGKLSEEEIKNLFSQMLDAVGYVHDKKLVHRDIKPSNFMINSEGQIKLLDFGIAKNTDTNSADYTQTGTTQNMGTPMYMSPEQIKSTKDVTLQSDIYSLGVVLWQLVTGTKPYNTNTTSTFELQTKIVTEKLTLTNSQFDSIIEVATAKETNNRYSNCLEFKKNLQAPFIKTDLSADDKTVVLHDDVTVVSGKTEKTIFESKEEKINNNNEINSKFSPIPRISFLGSYAYAIKNYANFKGRTNRRVYWNFTLISCLISFIPIIGFVHSLFILIPSISIAVRRMHDVGKSGWFVLLPIYGFILSVTKGNPYKNEYGENVQ